MPTYEYKCEECGVFEQMQKIADAPLTVCPECGLPVYRQMSLTYFKQDSMEAYRHPATGLWVDSKSGLRNMDEASGTITTDRRLAPSNARQIENKKKRKVENLAELEKIVAQIDSGNAPLTPELKERCKLENERITKASGFDAFNVAGRKDDPNGKRITGK